jgi:hypothetical protein
MGEALPRVYASLFFAVARRTKVRSKLPSRRARFPIGKGRRPRQRHHARGRHIMSEELGALSIFGSDREKMVGAQGPASASRSISRQNTLSETKFDAGGTQPSWAWRGSLPILGDARVVGMRDGGRNDAFRHWLGCKCVHFGATCIQLFLNQLHTIASMPKTSAISVRVADDVKAALERAAAEDHRPLASYVEKLLLEHLRANGYLAVEPTRAGRVAGGAAYARGMANSAIDRALEQSSESATVHRERRRALTEMPARPVVKERRGK